MSGLEPVAALSLACNILQIIGIGRETVRVARQVYQDGELDHPLTEDAGVLNDLSSQVRLITAVPSTAKPKAQDKQLLDLADKCQGAARDLQEEVNFLNGPPTRAKLVATLKIAAKTTWRKRRLEKLDQRLQDAERLLQSGLLTRIYERYENTDSQLSSLNAEFRDFIYEYRQGHANTADLTRKHVTREMKRTEDAVKSHVTQASSRTEDSLKQHIDVAIRDFAKQEQDTRLQSKRDQFLRSLKFERMNERQNQVSSSHPTTLTWLLRDGSEGGSDGRRSPTGTVKKQDDSNVSKEDISWDSFTDWLRSTETIYWISGKPGSGKSTVVKYLLGQSKTQEHLRQWKPDSILVSHFFWRPGTALQQSIKGLLCSLLHQLISEDVKAADQVRQTHDSKSKKDNEADWSNEELQSALHYVLRYYLRPVVMFLDGLDEVLPKDGALRLLEVVDELKEFHGHNGSLKLCLGSRREPLFCKRLCAYPQLRLELLNHSDLWQYGKDHIVVPPDYHISMPINFRLYHQGVHFNHNNIPSRNELNDWLVTSLVDKAEGVFLWLCLTATEITSALSQDEAIEVLQHRIHSLPGDLADLYADMWARKNHDSDYLKARAASYLQLAVSINESYAHEYHLNPFIMMVATTPGMADILLQSDPSDMVPVAVLIEACETTRRDAANRCAGLLECPSPKDLHVIVKQGLSPWHAEDYNRLIPYVLEFPVYSLLHRTARDFLLDTEAGRKILSWNSSTGNHVQLQLLKARLTLCRLFRKPIWNRVMVDHPRIPDGVQMQNVVFSNEVASFFFKMCNRTSKPRIRFGNDVSIRAELSQTFLLCEQLFNYGYIYAGPTLLPLSLRFETDQFWDRHYAFSESTVHGQYEFLIEAAIYSYFAPGIWDYLLPVVESRDVDGKTLSQLLGYACSFHARTWKPLEGMPPYDTLMDGIETRLIAIHKLLDMGAALYHKAPRRTRFIEEEGSPITTIIQTPFSALVMSIWDIAANSVPDEGLSQRLMDLICRFVAHGADLNEEVYVVIEIEGGLVEFRDLWRELAHDTLERPSKRWPLRAVHSPKGCVHMDLIVGHTASAMIGKILDIWKPKLLIKASWLSEVQGLAKPGLGQGHLIAMVDKSQLETEYRYGGLYRTGKAPTLFLGDMFPLGHINSLQQDLLSLMSLSDDGLQGATLQGEHTSSTNMSILSNVLVPMEPQTGLARAIERMRSEGVPEVDRRKEVRVKLGVCTPLEEPEWLEFSRTRGMRASCW